MLATRRLRSVPAWVRWLLPVTLFVQIVFRLVDTSPAAVTTALEAPPAMSTLRLASFGEPVSLAVALTLYLQSFDIQAGVSIPLRDLNYGNVISWLDSIMALDPAGNYPLLLASHVYARVPDEAKQRAMLQFIAEHFHDAPVRRWRWLAHAAIIARHRLNDPRLALAYAQAIASEANDPSVPSWARQMHIFLLADLGETEAAKILLGGLLASDSITDPHEIRFLVERLESLETAENSTESTNP